MAKSNSVNEHTTIESVELYITDTILKGENVIVPGIGHLELKTFDDNRRTVLFKPSDNTEPFLQVMSPDGNLEQKDDTHGIYNIISVPLKKGEMVNLPKIGVFRPVKRDDGKFHISFIPSSSLRSLLNKKEGEQIVEDKNTVEEKIEDVKNEDVKEEVKSEISGIKTLPAPSIPLSNGARITSLKENSNLGDIKKSVPTIKAEPETVTRSEKRHHKRRMNISGILLFLIVAAILLALIISHFHSHDDTSTVENKNLAVPSGTVSLPTLAEQHYGHSAFWIYIYKANMDKLQSPINIPQNVSLVFPDLKAEYGVDVNDSMEIRRANVLAEMILKGEINTSNTTPVITQTPIVQSDSVSVQNENNNNINSENKKENNNN